MISIITALKINMATNQSYYSLILIVYCKKLKPKMFMKILVSIKKMLDFINYSAKSNNMIIQTNQLLVKLNMGRVVLLQKNLLDQSQRCIRFWQMIVASIKKAEGVNRDVNSTISHSKYKDVLFKRKCFSHSMS